MGYSVSHSLLMKMKLILVVTLVSLALGAIPLLGQRSAAPEPIKEEKAWGDTDLQEELDEEQFEEEFGLEPITDPLEKQRRQEALDEAEKAEREQNESIKEWSDLPLDEFEKKKARDVENLARACGYCMLAILRFCEHRYKKNEIHLCWEARHKACRACRCIGEN